MRSVLITGGSGSWGSAFVSHLLEQDLAERVCVFSRGEHRQAEMREALGDPPEVRWLIGDVRDRDRLRRAMSGCNVVIHAAALKRIEVGAYNPTEMVRTNVEGAINVVEAAIDAGVSRVVALSSDKAWQPISPYGCSKAMAEAIFLSANNTTGGRGPTFVVTRYGNVAGSNGSVIPKWRKLQQQGELTARITDPRATRFYMTMQQAVELVSAAAFLPLQPANLETPIIPEGLPAYCLADLAEAMRFPDTRVIGLPPWEKLHEGMRDGYTSDTARRLTVSELRVLLAQI